MPVGAFSFLGTISQAEGNGLEPSPLENSTQRPQRRRAQRSRRNHRPLHAPELSQSLHRYRSAERFLGCAVRRVRGSERGRKNWPAPLGMTVFSLRGLRVLCVLCVRSFSFPFPG